MQERRKTVPLPRASREGYAIRELMMLADHAIILLPCAGIVIPVHHLHIPRNPAAHLIGNLEGLAVIGIIVAQFEKHIAPHHAGKTVFFADGKHTFQMAFHDVKPFLIPELAEKGAAANHLSLVHADVHHAAVEGFSAGAHHCLDELIRFLAAAAEDIRRVVYRIEGLPVKNAVEMRQRLDAGHQLHAIALRIGIQCAQIVLGVPAAQVSEEGIPGHFIGIFGIEHQPIVAHQGQAADQRAQKRERRDSIAGAIRHISQMVKCRFLVNRGLSCSLGQPLEQIARCPEQRRRRFTADAGLTPLPGDGKPFSSPCDGHGQFSLRTGQLQNFGELWSISACFPRDGDLHFDFLLTIRI